MHTKSLLLFPLQLFSETFIMLRRIQGDVIINVHRTSCKVPVFPVGWKYNLNFLHIFLKILNDEANSRFLEFCERA
jgi:hypothetical protein